MSRRGLQRVLECVSAVKPAEASQPRTAVQALKALIEVYHLVGAPTRVNTAQLRQSVTARLDALDAALDALFAAPAPAPRTAADG